MKLRTENILKSYNHRPVVRDVSLDVAPAEVVGLLGPNGAGKTTLFSIVVGLVYPEGGKVFLGEEDITHEPMYIRARKGIGYLPQEASVFRKMTTRENLLAILETLPIGDEERDERADGFLKEFSLTELSSQKAYTLSGGERRRLEIARSLLLSPKFLLLDEPFSGIDPIAVLEIQKIIARLKERGIGVLLTDHNVRETLRITDRAYILSQGEIYRADTPERLVADSEVRRIYLGNDFKLH